MLTKLFERAAFRAGWRAARAGIPFHENPLRGPLARFVRQWGCGWAAANDCPRAYNVYDWEQGICSTSAEPYRDAA
ncbi:MULTISPECIES: hypothetical protein [Burkholderia]|uniref:Uncharacterized protein n=1 Tax=Burkholderia anthinoferrum TaxID=3090833 RepID=A0ABU5WTE7_9BURK|nr:MULTISPECIES: hypothetical protein [Burkholderia]MEB2535876.1 hypothetical protein [Burkholderia anthinoferrum]MEB2562004.1 hypothetical protein [Burkholderia anthinoferrum]MEB2582305.1 hypothetical protein [Burkholderia anthinoferrum]KVN62718.1 hypothetical protein WT13_14580 [Burkholderia anthina]MCA8242856.1 hypothetical protein [Burkholderia sp. AU32262]